MSGFSPELIEYLEGKISFEEFERRREERKSCERKVRPLLPRSFIHNFLRVRVYNEVYKGVLLLVYVFRYPISCLHFK